MKRILFTITLSFLLLSGGLFAGNPVSLLSFYESYSHLAIIQTIHQNNRFDGNVAAFLLDENNSISDKLAAMNALIGHNQFSNSAETYKMFISRKYNTNFQTIDLDILTGEELLCLGYLSLIDKEGDPALALPILAKASAKKQNNQSVQMIYALVSSQEMINKGQPCEAWKNFNQLTGKSLITNDLDEPIASRISNEMQAYSDACN